MPDPNLCPNCGYREGENHDLRCVGREVTLQWREYQALLAVEEQRDLLISTAKKVIEAVDSPEDFGIKGLAGLLSYIDLLRPLVAQNDSRQEAAPPARQKGQCPKCGRKKALVRGNVHDDGVTRACRWCDYEAFTSFYVAGESDDDA